MVKGGNIMFIRTFTGEGHLGFNSSVHSPIKNFVEKKGGRQLHNIVATLTQQTNLLQRMLNARGDLIG